LSGQPIVPVTPAARGSFVLVVPRGRLFDRTDQVVSENFENAVELLRGAGATVLEGSLDTALDALAAMDRIGNFCVIEMNAILRKLGFHDLGGVDPDIRAKVEAGADVPAADYMRMLRMREATVRSFASMMPPNEIFILPTAPIRAPLLSSLEETTAFDESDSLLLRNPRVANLLDCPSISLPIPGAGLPVSLMLIGRRNSDHKLINVASWIEAVLAGIEPTKGQFRRPSAHL
jgi:aspartyl-tRNA(Asn)/glutamyl-tRNA(Gln) amidotransferase subunit A